MSIFDDLERELEGASPTVRIGANDYILGPSGNPDWALRLARARVQVDPELRRKDLDKEAWEGNKTTLAGKGKAIDTLLSNLQLPHPITEYDREFIIRMSVQFMYFRAILGICDSSGIPIITDDKEANQCYNALSMKGRLNELIPELGKSTPSDSQSSSTNGQATQSEAEGIAESGTVEISKPITSVN